MTQELQLAKHEVQQEVSKLVKAAIQAGVSAILSLMAVILLCLTLVYVLHSLLGFRYGASMARSRCRRRGLLPMAPSACSLLIPN